MTSYSRKNGSGNTCKAKEIKIKRLKRGLDQIDDDIKPHNAKKLLNQDMDLDLPGLAQFYCLHCARYFINNKGMTDHFRTKIHKRRLKALELEPYSQKEAEAAAGMGNYVPPKRRKIESQPLKE